MQLQSCSTIIERLGESNSRPQPKPKSNTLFTYHLLQNLNLLKGGLTWIVYIIFNKGDHVILWHRSKRLPLIAWIKVHAKDESISDLKEVRYKCLWVGFFYWHESMSHIFIDYLIIIHLISIWYASTFASLIFSPVLVHIISQLANVCPCHLTLALSYIFTE